MSSSSTVADWPVRPIRWRTASGSATTSNPATRAVPLVGMLSVVIIRTVVVLPAPLGPSIEKTVPVGHREADAVDGGEVVERLDEVDRLDGRGAHDTRQNGCPAGSR